MHVTPSALRSIEMATEHSCNVCNELAELTSASSDDSPVLLLEPEDLHRNVRQGCPFCGIIYCALTAWSGHKDIPINGVYLELGYYPSSEGVDLDGDLGRALKLEAFFTDDDCLKLEIFCAAGKRPTKVARRAAEEQYKALRRFGPPLDPHEPCLIIPLPNSAKGWPSNG